MIDIDPLISVKLTQDYNGVEKGVIGEYSGKGYYVFKGKNKIITVGNLSFFKDPLYFEIEWKDYDAKEYLSKVFENSCY